MVGLSRGVVLLPSVVIKHPAGMLQTSEAITAFKRNVGLAIASSFSGPNYEGEHVAIDWRRVYIFPEPYGPESQCPTVVFAEIHGNDFAERMETISGRLRDFKRQLTQVLMDLLPHNPDDDRVILSVRFTPVAQGCWD